MNRRNFFNLCLVCPILGLFGYKNINITKDTLILSEVSGISCEKSVKSITSAINSMNKCLLDSTSSLKRLNMAFDSLLVKK